MSKMEWPPEKTIKYEFNSLERDYVEIRAEDGSERPNSIKSKGGKREDGR